MPILSVAEAGSRLAELVGKAEAAPTVLIVHSRPAAVIVGIAEYRALASAGRRTREARRLPALPAEDEALLPYDFSDLDDLDLAAATL